MEPPPFDSEDPLRDRSLATTSSSVVSSPSQSSPSTSAAATAVDLTPTAGPIETELLDVEEFNFLDNSTRLAELQIG